MRPLRTLTATVIAVLAAAAPAAAAPRTVVVDDDDAQCPHADATSIQAGVDLAGPGATVAVCPGTYAGRVVVSTPRLRLQARGPVGSVVIDAGGLDERTWGVAALADGVRVRGFAIRGFGEGLIPNAGILFGGVPDATGDVLRTPVIGGRAERNAIQGPQVLVVPPEGGNPVGMDGDGVAIYGARGVTIRDNRIAWVNEGVNLQPAPHVLVRDNRISQTGNWGVLGFAPGGRITGNRIDHAEEDGMNLQQAADVAVDRNVVRDSFGGMVFQGIAGLRLRENRITGTGYGFVLNDLAGFSMREDRVEATTGDGIRIGTSSGGRVEHVRATGNAGTDAVWDGAGTVAFRHNRCGTALPSRAVWDCR